MKQDLLIAHITDIHYPLMTAFKLEDIFSKRVTGAFNLFFNRHRRFRSYLLKESLAHIRRLECDYLLVTGDISNLGYLEEFEAVKNDLQASGFSPENTCVVPGNHDVYTKTSFLQENFWKGMGDYSHCSGPEHYPVRTRIDNIEIIGLSSAVPSPPGMAWGKLGRQQLDRLETILSEKSLFRRVIIIHHPPCAGPDSWDDGLIDAADLRAVLWNHKIEVVLHGHEHFDMSSFIDGEMGGRIPVLGTGCAILDNYERPGNGARIRFLRFVDGSFQRTWVAQWSPDTGHFKNVE
ncbi:metallophosphoesterase [Myxococcota bacterium]|nr:metallophosphoesterase [Myxococcota bacterium]MBU1381318.1 metallophosphoesterase [Myxococcota bacterium]MBU1495695.1 metallophosphoesterase [Myxococcota bacterium]